MKPVVDGLEKSYSGKVLVKRYNTDNDQAGAAMAAKLGLNYIPSFAFVNRDGTLSSTAVGAISEQEFRQKLDALK